MHIIGFFENYTRSVLVTQSLDKSGTEIRTHLISLLNEGAVMAVAGWGWDGG